MFIKSAMLFATEHLPFILSFIHEVQYYRVLILEMRRCSFLTKVTSRVFVRTMARIKTWQFPTHMGFLTWHYYLCASQGANPWHHTSSRVRFRHFSSVRIQTQFLDGCCLLSKGGTCLCLNLRCYTAWSQVSMLFSLCVVNNEMGQLYLCSFLSAPCLYLVSICGTVRRYFTLRNSFILPWGKPGKGKEKFKSFFNIEHIIAHFWLPVWTRLWHSS